ncbi:hypothetical protein CB1_001541014 [Camelus ferus]|nr:hypothetical protein CB1_001541014 [Camelus ferus]
MFFTHDRSFEEFFCICIQLLNKTWKEMRATSEDFNKVPLDPQHEKGSSGFLPPSPLVETVFIFSLFFLNLDLADL